MEEADEDEEEKDDGAAKVKIERDFTLGEDIIEPIEAVVRIKIPKMPVEIERDDEGNEGRKAGNGAGGRHSDSR